MNVTMMPVYLKRRILVPDAPRTRRPSVICQKLYVYIEHFASISAFECSPVNLYHQFASRYRAKNIRIITEFKIMQK